MKIYFTSTVLIALGLSLSLNAQTGKKNRARAAGQAAIIAPGEVKQNDAKTNFVKNQDYFFSAGEQKDNKRLFGDSLKGFDEAKIKSELLSHNVFGKEYANYITMLKREFIDNKYRIGARFMNKTAANQPNQSASRPGGGGNSVNLFPCVNEDFELTTPGVYTVGNAVAGWTVSSRARTSCNSTASFASGSAEFSIVATPILNVLPSGAVLNVTPLNGSPLGGTNVALLNDQAANGNAIETKLSQTFPVTTANTLFQFAFAGTWRDGGHQCCEQPQLNILMYNCAGAPLTCSSISLNPQGSGCSTGGSGYQSTGTPGASWSWTNWQTRFIDLTPFVGTCVTIEITNSDCIFSGHAGSVYVDTRCGGALVGLGLSGVGGSTPGTVSFCQGANQALLNAPLGYATYQWFAPNPGNPPTAISPTLGGNTPAVTVMNPVPGTVYTVGLVTASGCSYTSVDTLKFSTVNIVGLGTNSTCPGGASGTATVQGNGSGAGYNYTWTPAGTTSVVGTASTVTGLGPGVYSVTITGFGSAGCGSSVATVTIGVSPPNIYTIIKPFCGNFVVLSSLGSNFQWYLGTTSISAVNGGTLSTLTDNQPVNGRSYWLTYTSPQNCRDSVNFILSQTPAGNMFVNNFRFTCPNTSIGSAVVNIIPASGAPQGFNSYSVFATGNTPSYTSAIFPTAANTYTPMNMAAGTYDVSGFDGVCYYSNSFTISNLVYNYAVTPLSSTLCPGNSIFAGVSFSNAIGLGQYSFSWSPATHVVGGQINTSNISIQIAPTIPINSVSTIVYSITVIPTIAFCPITKTISVTAANLQIPTITTPPPFCNSGSTAGLKSVTVSPMGTSPYVFSTGIPGGWINANTGVINPPLMTSFGTNTFVVSTSVGTCVASNVGNVSISQFNSAALSATVINQCSTNPPVNLMGIVANQVTGVWSGPQNVVANNSFFPNQITGVYTLTYNTSSTPNALVCPDSRTINVATSQTVAPFITSVSPFCTNRPTFGMLASPPGGSWSGGVPLLVTPAGIVNPAMASLGNNVLTYVVNTGACVNTATTVLNATQFRSSALTSSISNQCFGNPSINLMSLVQTPGGSWSGQGVNLGTSMFTPSLSTGIYPLVYNISSVPNPTVCPSTRTLMVSVLRPEVPSISQPAPHCNADAPFLITVTPNTGSFTPTAYLTSDGWYTPALSPLGNNTIQYIIGTNTCSASDSKMISIEGYVPATLIGTVPNLCNTSSNVNLSVLTLSNSGSWSGSGVVGSTFDPGLAGAGSVVLVYNTSSIPSGLCPANSTLAVNVFSLASPSIEEEGPYCNSKATIKLRVSPLGGVFTGMNNNAVDAFGQFSPSSAMIGDNIINYSITAGPCVAYGQSVIKIEKFISADFSKYPGPFCRNDKAFDMSSVVQNQGGDFSGPGMSGNMFTALNANIGNNNLITYRTHSMPTESLCPHTSTVQVLVNKNPEVVITSNLNNRCLPVEVTFNTPSTNTGKGEWTLGDGSSPVTGLTVNHTYTASGSYSVVFNYWDNLGCLTQAVLENPIPVYELPKAAFTYGSNNEDLTISDPEVHFTNLSNDLKNNTYNWQIGNLYDSPAVEPTVTFPGIGKYEITLTATNIQGCTDKTTQILEIKNDFGIYVPNSFTPNDDGINDVFMPVFTPFGLDAKTFDMEIFDRWGVSLYRTKDVTKGWNGSIQNKGIEPLKQEVYVYKLKYKDMNGVIYNKLGYLSLVK